MNVALLNSCSDLAHTGSPSHHTSNPDLGAASTSCVRCQTTAPFLNPEWRDANSQIVQHGASGMKL